MVGDFSLPIIPSSLYCAWPKGEVSRVIQVMEGMGLNYQRRLIFIFGSLVQR